MYITFVPEENGYRINRSEKVSKWIYTYTTDDDDLLLLLSRVKSMMTVVDSLFFWHQQSCSAYLYTFPCHDMTLHCIAWFSIIIIIRKERGFYYCSKLCETVTLIELLTWEGRICIVLSVVRWWEDNFGSISSRERSKCFEYRRWLCYICKEKKKENSFPPLFCSFSFFSFPIIPLCIALLHFFCYVFRESLLKPSTPCLSRTNESLPSILLLTRTMQA